MLARVLGHCDSSQCFNHRIFQCQQYRVLHDPLVLAELFQRLELAELPRSNMSLRVRVGSSVVIRQTHCDNAPAVLRFTVVEPSSANPTQGKVSYLSPMGLALLSVPLGAVFTVTVRASESHWCLIALN
ncbi:GreA/GreB family elongation factor [Pseudidiomarina sp.]|uniref:GreA/GreB family elongation factor n=1 Tax=Pseudidiomarina sp. TaxID=2081707 RepID=UPI003A980722